jgi:hypothetical protein
MAVVARFEPTNKVLDVANRSLEDAMRQIAPEIQSAIKKQLTRKKYPPASKPFTHPAKRTGNLANSVQIQVSRKGRRPALQLKTIYYGEYLQNGTPNMEPRPFGADILFQKKWIKRLGQIAAQATRARRRRSA